MYSWLAWHLPRGLIKHAALRVWIHATTEQWGDTLIQDVTMSECMRRWSLDSHLDS